MRLADRIFAPHYAANVDYLVALPTALRAGRDEQAESLAQLTPGDLFEVLELSAGSAWGRAPGHGLVGYVDASRLEVAT